MDKLVDFSQPIEAVRSDGLVCEATAFHRDGDKPSVFFVSVPGHFGWPFSNTGGPRHLFSGPHQWTVRNVDTAKPSTPSNEELTQRMEKAGVEAITLVKRLAGMGRPPSALTFGTSIDRIVQHQQEMERLLSDAARFVSDLPKPVDPIDADLIEARELCARDAEATDRTGLAAEYRSGQNDHRMVRLVKDAIKRGRELGCHALAASVKDHFDSRTLAAGGTAHE